MTNGRPGRRAAIIFTAATIIVLMFVCLIGLHYGEVQY
jgi:hypothetical protein